MTFRTFAKWFGISSISFLVLVIAIGIWFAPEPHPGATEQAKQKTEIAATDETCGSDDRQCVLEWFSDYRDRILNEFRAVREYEGQIAVAVAMDPRDDWPSRRFKVIGLTGDPFNTNRSSRQMELGQTRRASSIPTTPSSSTAGAL
jgi:hypothetical protein